MADWSPQNLPGHLVSHRGSQSAGDFHKFLGLVTADSAVVARRLASGKEAIPDIWKTKSERASGAQSQRPSAAEIDKGITNTLSQFDAIFLKCEDIARQGIQKNKTYKSQNIALWRQSGNIIRQLAAASAPAYPTSAARSGEAHPGRRGMYPHKPGHLRRATSYGVSPVETSVVVAARKFKTRRGWAGGKGAAAAWYSQFKTSGIVRSAGGSQKRADVADDWMQRARKKSINPISVLWAEATGAQLAGQFNSAARAALAGVSPSRAAKN